MVFIYLSSRYQYKSDNLWEQYQSKKLDDEKDEKYASLLEEIQKEELRQSTDSNRGSWEREVWKYEVERKEREQEAETTRYIAKQEAETTRYITEQEHKRMEQLRNRSPQQKYRDEVPIIIEKYRKESRVNRRVHNFFQWIIIIGSILVTSATSAIGISDNFKWVGAAISIFVTVSAGATGYFKFRERSFNLQQTADAIEHEYKAAGLGIYIYKDLSLEKNLVLLAERVESLILEQQKKEQTLEQSPEITKVEK